MHPFPHKQETIQYVLLSSEILLKSIFQYIFLYICVNDYTLICRWHLFDNICDIDHPSWVVFMNFIHYWNIFHSHRYHSSLGSRNNNINWSSNYVDLFLPSKEFLIGLYQHIFRIIVNAMIERNNYHIRKLFRFQKYTTISYNQ